MAATDSNAEALSKLRFEQTAFQRALMSEVTLTGYAADWKVFFRWCERFQLAALPATAETVGLFLTDQLRVLKVATARRRKFAIAYRHRSEGLTSPVTPEVAGLLIGAQRLRAEKPVQKRPITVKELRQMSAKLGQLGTATAMRDRALIVVGFASSLRRSNLAALSISDVEFVSQGLIVSVSREKQDQEGKGRLVGLPRGQHVHTDPSRVLRAWLRIRGRKPGALFPRMDNGHEGEQLDGESVCRILQKAVTLVGLDGSDFGAHSMRAGMVTAAGEANISALRISAFTAQSPETVRHYFRRRDLWRDNIAGKLGL